MADQFLSVAVRLTATTSISIYSPGTASTGLLRSLSLCNSSTSATTSVDVQLLKSGSTNSIFFGRFTQIATAQSVEAISSPVVVEAGDTLKVQAADANQIDVIASLMRRT